MGIELTSGVHATLLEEAARAHPFECCGLLLGQGVRIERAVPAANVHPDPARHFEIDPAALITAHKAERSGGAQLLGYYHSHPNGRADPSPSDRAQAAGDGRLWAIVANEAVLVWRDTAAGFQALPLRLVEG
ncbi:M67 family metallopeptidase [Novosphingobium aquiterrae]|uniref:M67 family metallopeptidase n=1 Tax=Novosphingobium aquiterrae TaxID=624388 RepID=A0ABV6PFB0_9SPHN